MNLFKPKSSYQRAKKSVKENPLKAAIAGLIIALTPPTALTLNSWVNKHFANQEIQIYGANHTMIQNDERKIKFQQFQDSLMKVANELLTLEKSHHK